MSTEAVLQFMERTGQDEQIRQQLEVILGVGDGDISSAQEMDAQEAEVLKSIRGSTVASFASQHGFAFTAGDLTQVVETLQRLQAQEISATEFQATLGLPPGRADSSAPTPAIQRTLDLVYRGIRYKLVSAPAPEQAAARRTVIQFMEGTAGNQALQQQLQSLLGVGDGDISGLAELDPEEISALKGQRGAQVVEFAAQKGYDFSIADLNAVVDAFQRLRSGDLSEAAFSVTVGLTERSSQPLASLGQIMDMVYRGVPLSPSIRSRSPQTAAVLQFMERTARDIFLRDQLRALLGVGDGDISGAGALDPQEIEALQGQRGEAVTEFALHRGYRFTVEDLTRVAHAYQQLQAGEISEEAFPQTIGLAAADKGLTIKKAVTFFYRGLPVN